MKPVNKAHNFKVKFDAATVIFIKAYTLGLVGMLIYIIYDVWQQDIHVKYVESPLMKFAAWYLGLFLAIMVITNVISRIATKMASKHFKQYNWA